LNTADSVYGKNQSLLSKAGPRIKSNLPASSHRAHLAVCNWYGVWGKWGESDPWGWGRVGKNVC